MKLNIKGIKCTNCGSIVTIGENKVAKQGATAILMGCLLTLFIVTAIIGIPMIIVGFYRAFIKARKCTTFTYRCISCKNTWEGEPDN